MDIQLTPGNKEFYALPGDGSVQSGIKFGSEGSVQYWVSHTYTLCNFGSKNTKEFEILDNFCKQETNNGRKGCNSSSNCYYHF